jgi:putative sigma-54 modulation protein
MQISVTFRHVDPTPALRSYAEEKLARVKKYLRRPVDAHVILSVAKDRHVAEITLKADHVTMFAQEETHDLYSAIDLALDKLEHQAQKLKAKRRSHKGRAEPRRAGSGRVPETEGDARTAPRLIRAEWTPGKPLTPEEAVARLETSGDGFVVFTSASNQMMAVLYRRRDGNYCLIESKGR